jgi:hypothetical protein
MNIQIIFIMDNDAREISIFSAALDDVVVVVVVVVAATPPAVVVEVDEDELYKLAIKFNYRSISGRC